VTAGTVPVVATSLVPATFDLTAWGSWRPVPTERVQATVVAPGLVRLAASPFLAAGVAKGDVVAVSSTGTGWTVDALVEPAAVSVLRLLGGSREELAPAVYALAEIGLTARRHASLGVAVIDVPVGRSLVTVSELAERICHALTVVEISCHRH
jgi:hypothetical protein